MKKKWHLDTLYFVTFCVFSLTSLPLFANNTVKSSETLAAQFVSIPELFTDLERGPVKFPHDQHTEALKSENCSICHQTDQSESLSFSFPKNQNAQDRESLINVYHDACIGCHQERHESGLKAGPELCGECHIAENKLEKKEYLAKDHTYYKSLQDTYHQDCLTCHNNGAVDNQTVEELDWKSFYIKTVNQKQAHWPKAEFTNALHNKHEKSLENKCDNCHFLSPALKSKLLEEGEQPDCQDWLKTKPLDGGFTDRNAAHKKCIGCHLKNDRMSIDQSESKKEVNNTFCRDCHKPSQKDFTETVKLASIQCNQKEKILIQSQKQPRLPAVPFNHNTHQSTKESCQSCHHNNSLAPCSDCHRPEGIDKGENITLYEAFHLKTSSLSCIGCHELEKKASECSGCHESIIQLGNTGSCKTCHSGNLDQLTNHQKLPDPTALIAPSTLDHLNIKRLENEYQAADFPHLKVVKKLTEIANNNPLASYFHVQPTTLCQSCHHNAPVEKDIKPPKCQTCHSARNEPVDDVPTLLGAYHQGCLGCHKKMSTPEMKLPQECIECHQAKLNTKTKK